MESCFVRPEEFIPERWYSQPELVKNKRSFLPFSFGMISLLPLHLSAEPRLLGLYNRNTLHVLKAKYLSGRSNCVGKNLALSEIRFVTALLISNYNVHFKEGDDGSATVDDMADQFTAAPGHLDLVFEPWKGAI